MLKSLVFSRFSSFLDITTEKVKKHRLCYTFRLLNNVSCEEENGYYKGTNFVDKPGWVIGADTIGDTVYGGNGQDTIISDDTIDSDDYFVGGNGKDSIFGGGGVVSCFSGAVFS